MPFQKGHKKSGGRKKGVPNKRTQAFLDILEEHGFCPVQALIKNYRLAMKEYRRSADVWDAIEEKKSDIGLNTPTEDTGHTYLKIAQSAAADLMQYAHPKRKAIEIDAKEGGPLEAYLRMSPEERAHRRAQLEKRLGKSS